MGQGVSSGAGSGSCGGGLGVRSGFLNGRSVGAVVRREQFRTVDGVEFFGTGGLPPTGMGLKGGFRMGGGDPEPE